MQKIGDFERERERERRSLLGDLGYVLE